MSFREYRLANMVKLFISKDLAHHEVFRAKDGEGGISNTCISLYHFYFI